jgi:hypothetical protein
LGTHEQQDDEPDRKQDRSGDCCIHPINIERFGIRDGFVNNRIVTGHRLRLAAGVGLRAWIPERVGL